MSLDFMQQQQLTLKVNVETRYQQDVIITQIRQMVKDFNVMDDSKKSPFRNVLNVATEPGSSLETVKTYIRYQTGRKDGSGVWKAKYQGQSFAEAVIKALDNLSGDAKQIIDRVRNPLGKQEPDETQNRIEEFPRTSAEEERLQQDLHLKLMQLYLGYLYRECVAAMGEPTNNGGQSQGGQRPPTNHQNRQPTPAGRPQPRN
jgi:hypothetical protein